MTDRSAEAGLRLARGWAGVGVAVIVVHNVGTFFWARSISSPILNVLLYASWVGVPLLFMVAGLAVTGMVLDRPAGQRFPLQVYGSLLRATVPVWYLTLLIAFVALPLVLPTGDWTASVSEGQRWYWLLPGHLSSSDHVTISGFEHSWALLVALQLIMIWPLVIIVGGLRALAVTGALAITFDSVVLALGIPAGTVYHVAPTWLGAVTAGSLLAFLWRSESGLALVRRYRTGAFVVTTIGLVAMVLARHGFVAWDPVVVDIGVDVIVLWFSVLIASSMLDESRADHYLRSLLHSRALQFLGRHVFLIYVLHFPIHRLLSVNLVLLPSGSALLDSGERLGYVVLVLVLSATVATLLRRGLTALRIVDH